MASPYKCPLSPPPRVVRLAQLVANLECRTREDAQQWIQWLSQNPSYGLEVLSLDEHLGPESFCTKLESCFGLCPKRSYQFSVIPAARTAQEFSEAKVSSSLRNLGWLQEFSLNGRKRLVSSGTELQGAIPVAFPVASEIEAEEIVR